MSMNLSATRTGNGHIRRRLHCQDAVFTLDSNNYAVLITLDGCSSAPMAQFGAYAIGKHLEQFFSEPGRYLSVTNKAYLPVFGDDLCRYFTSSEERIRQLGDFILRESHKRTAELVDKTNAASHADFSTTLQLAIINKSERQAVVIGVGDGFAVAGFPDGTSELITGGENRGRSNGTYFLTNPTESYKHIRFYIANGFDSICLSTDGLLKAADLISEEGFTERDLLMNHLKESTATDSNLFMRHLLQTPDADGSLLFKPASLIDDVGVAYFRITDKPIRKRTRKRLKHIKFKEESLYE